MSDPDAYQIEIEKRGQYEVIELLISTVRGARGKRKLFGEAFTHDALTPRIHFRVQHAKDHEQLLDHFMRQLIHRGYKPLRLRPADSGYWGDWSAVDLDKFDISDLDRWRQPPTFSNA